MSAVRFVARWLVRLEFVWLTPIYLYFVVTDQIPFAAFVLIALIWLARWFTTGRLTRATLFDLPILLLLVCLPVSYSVSIYAWQSLPKVYGMILGIAFFYATVNAITTRRDLQLATIWLVVVCAVVALAGLIGTDWAQGKIISASFIYDNLPRFIQAVPRSIAGGFARNGVGGTLTFTIPLLAALVFAQNLWDADKRGQTQADVIARSREATTKQSPKNFERHLHSRRGVVQVLLRFARNDTLAVWFLRAAIFSFALSLLTLALTQSRGGILGAAVGVFAVAVWRERRLAWLVVAGAVGLVAVLALGYGNALIDFVLRMDAQSGTLASRLEVWQRGWMMVQDFPFTGIGIGTFNSVAHLLYPFFIAAPDEVVAHAHNQFLEVAVDLGIPGLIAYIGLLAAFVVTSMRAYRAADDAGARALIVGLGCGMLAHHVFGLTDAFILGTKPGVVMWIFFAFVVAMDGLVGATHVGSHKGCPYHGTIRETE